VKKVILRSKNEQFRWYYLIFGFILIPATGKKKDLSIIKDILRSYPTKKP